MGTELKRIPLTRIVRSRWQPREAVFDAERLWELARSIAEQGLINPVVVFPKQRAEVDGEPAGPQFYELVAGERRTRAVMGLAWAAVDGEVAEKAAVEALAAGGLKALPGGVRLNLDLCAEHAGDGDGWGVNYCQILARVESGESAEDLQRLHRMAVVENIERESLTALEEARALEGLAEEFGWSQRELARHIGKSQSYVAQRLSLLGLTAEAQEAVSTRVLTATHGRAIAKVPEALQPVVTEHVAAMVSRDDSPATTRQVQNLTRQVAAFVDPQRWEPSKERVYQPQERNRLALIKWVVERADLAACAERLMGLRSVGYSNDNALGKKPVSLVDSWYFDDVLQALGETHAGKTWDAFAKETGRTCERCVFGDVGLDFESRDDDEVDICCPRLDGKVGAESCEDFIGLDDPLVIPVPGYKGGSFKKVGAPLEEGDGFFYMRSVPDYIKAVTQINEQERARAAEQKQKRDLGYQNDIRAFMDWIGTLPGEVHAHFQAQVCGKCAHCAPAVDPPCFFTQEPLGDTWRRSAPAYTALVSQDGTIIPRCAEFAYAGMPAIYAKGNEKLGKKRAGEWLEEIAKSVSRGYGSTSRIGLPGVMRWLDYGRKPEKDDFEKLKRYVKREWDELGGDTAVVTLIDVALHEARAVRGNGATLKLLNAVTGEVEEFAAVSFKSMQAGTMDWWIRWPNGWPTPWVKEGAEDPTEEQAEDWEDDDGD